MQSITTLAQSDPYLKMPKHERIAARKARRANLRKLGKLEATIDAVSETPVASAPVVEPVFSFGAWVSRQEQINPLPKAPWFSIVSDCASLERRQPRIEEIQAAVCRHYRVKRADMISDLREKWIVRPRQVAVYICRQMTVRSLPEIGRRFGGRDHTTQLHAIRKIAALMEGDAAFAAEITSIMESLGGVRA